MNEKIVRKELIHTGKANNVYATNFPEYLELESSDRISAGNGAKRDIIEGKGVVNNTISSILFQYLQKKGIPTHYVGEGSNKASKIVKVAEMIPLEVIGRLYTDGSFCKRYGCEKGIKFPEPLVEYTYKSDSTGDPLIDRKTIIALSKLTRVRSELELALIEYYTTRVGIILSDFYKELGIKLVDYKVEYGRIPSGEIILCDEVSPDTCRLVDMKTSEKLDKDIFREDLGDVSKGYEKVYKKVLSRKQF